jgi:hypothetical protein
MGVFARNICQNINNVKYKGIKIFGKYKHFYMFYVLVAFPLIGMGGTFQHDTSSESFNAWGKCMAADDYRRHAIECLRLADETVNANSRVLLLHMAEAWLRLVHQAEKNLLTDLVYETPLGP